MKLSKISKGKKWAARSQASFLREWDLRASLDKCTGLLRYNQRALESAQQETERRTKAAVLGSDAAAGMLPQSIGEAEDRKSRIAIFEAQRANVQAQIDTLVNVSPSEAKQRAEQQSALAQLAIARLELDRSLALTVESLRMLLAKRLELTGKMYGLGRTIDFTWAFDGIDKDRFQALENALPDNLLGQSEKWVGWFLGEGQETESYTILDETLTLAETLANANVFRRGERIELTAEQLQEVSSVRSSADYPLRPLPPDQEVKNPRVEKCVQAGK